MPSIAGSARRPLVLALAACVAAAGGCGGEAGAAATPSADSGQSTDAAAGRGADAADDAAANAADASADSHPGPALPPAPEPYDGVCPDLQAGTVTLQVGAYERTLQVRLPAEPKGAAVLFLWHGLGDNAKNMTQAFGGQALADALGAIVIAPEACGNQAATAGCKSMLTGWHFVADAALDAGIFDAALACVHAQYQTDRARTYTMGFSAGALWSTWLVMHRGAQLAAAAVLSGGVNAYLPWAMPERPVPVLTSSGGPTDTFGGGLVDFQKSTEDLHAELRPAGHLVVHCQHQSGHTITSAIAQFAVQFLAAHVYDPQGSSPYAGGLPASAPTACALVP